ncbi:carboxypeptidase regulatory-like domain-containing protein [Candidatus Aerophobetes bacterium]|nr:carboxypeptidase regulatory-like domain-containing protein [Candidatus Aerophobetes bacterium]
MRKFIPYTVIAIVIVVIVALFVGLRGGSYGTIQGKAPDELSGDPVRGLRIVVDGRSTIMYRSTTYKLTKIPPGKYTLKAVAPNYYDFSKEVKIHRGKNLLNFAMRGKEIPDLSGIIVFTDSKEEGIQIEVRFTDSKGVGITDFPCLPIKIEGTLWKRIGEEENYVKGEKIFEGPIKHFWDSNAYLAKNKGIIPWDKIKVKPKKDEYGILDVRVHLKQGDFKDTVDDVKLFKEEG